MPQEDCHGSTSSKTRQTFHVCSFENCNKIFKKASRLVHHERIHTGERPFKCSYEDCNHSYTQLAHLKRHLSTTHQPKQFIEKIECEKCGKSFTNIYSLKRHDSRYHIFGKFTCETCGQLFHKQQHLDSHTFHHTGINPYKCDHPGCDKSYRVPSRLKRHKLQHLSGWYACPHDDCDQEYDCYNDLRTHLKLAHPKSCSVCGRIFQQSHKLIRHMATHAETREAYFCPVPHCNKCYYEERTLANHIEVKHKGSKRFCCDECGRQLSTKQKLIGHMITHNPGYKRNYKSNKPRKPRKDKGIPRKNFARALSGYDGLAGNPELQHPPNLDVTETSEDSNENEASLSPTAVVT